MKWRIACGLTLALGFVSVVALVLMHLALTDIYHGEFDVTQEWNMVRLGSVIILAFQLSALAVLWRAYRGASR